MMLVYFDSVIVIYYLDQVRAYYARAASRLTALRSVGYVVAISDLVRMECRIGPLRSGDYLLLAKYETFFSGADVLTVPITHAVFDRAAEIRARHGFKTPDSIHLAAAVEAGCDRFLTHDSRLARFPGLVVEILP